MKKFLIVALFIIVLLTLAKYQIESVNSDANSPVINSLIAKSPETPYSVAKQGDPVVVYGDVTNPTGNKMAITCGSSPGGTDVCPSTEFFSTTGVSGLCPQPNQGWGQGSSGFPFNDNSRHFIYCTIADKVTGASTTGTTYIDADNSPPTTTLYKICDELNNCGSEARRNNFTLYLYCNDSGD